MVAVGDIGNCGVEGDERTAELARGLEPDALLALGDIAYTNGTADEFNRCYAPSWGAITELTYPTPGNHEYLTPGAAGYFGYFGERAPRPFYSFNLGAWHLVSLNSEIARERGSAQERWLRRDLTRDRRRCELLFWHRPRWSGGMYPSDRTLGPLWRAAYELGVDLVLVGHDHNYQRFAPLDAGGRLDPRHGVRQIVAGTGGGGSFYQVGTVPHLETFEAGTLGVVKLLLRPGAYGMRFVPVAGSTFTDVIRGQACHGPPVAATKG